MASSSSFAFSWAPPLRSPHSSPPRRHASSSPPPSRDHVSAAGHSRSKSAPSPRLMGNWRATAAPLPPSRSHSPPPSRPECCLGLVVKLPKQHEVPVTSRFHQEVAGKSMGHPWNHPVVITGISERNGKQLVSVRSCTSWGGQGIAARKQAKHHHYYVEADETQLRVGSGKFEKRTWVNCSPGHELTIEFEHLQLWTGKAIQFRQSALDSFNENSRARRDSVFEA